MQLRNLYLQNLYHQARRRVAMGVSALTLMPAMAMAQSGLPELEEPSQGGGGIMSTAQGYIYDGFILGGLILTAAVFIWVGIASLKSFNEARDGRGDWSKFGVTFVLGVGLVLAVIWLATEAAPILAQ